jgi:hypothetical protein
MDLMAFKHRIFSRRKLSASIAAGVAALAVATGGYAIADSGSSSSAAATTNAAATTSVASTSSATTPTAGTVIPFQQGQPSPATPVGQVPANFTDGSGTLVTGTAADKAKAAAAAAYPGGTVNRVSVLSNGEYNVHMIGVNWPHHIFVDQNFKVVGAE